MSKGESRSDLKLTQTNSCRLPPSPGPNPIPITNLTLWSPFPAPQLYFDPHKPAPTHCQVCYPVTQGLFPVQSWSSATGTRDGGLCGHTSKMQIAATAVSLPPTASWSLQLQLNTYYLFWKATSLVLPKVQLLTDFNRPRQTGK